MLKPLKNQKTYPLTEPQKTLLWSLVFSLEKQNAKCEFNTPISFYDPSEDSNLEAMEKAFNRLIELNDALRLRIYKSAKGIRQFVGDHEYTKLPRCICQNMDAFHDEENHVYDHMINVFDNKLYAATLYAFPDGTGGIIMNFHHLALDGYSASLVMERFERYYSMLKKGDAFPETEKVFSYHRFIETEKQYKKSKQFKEDFKYWWGKYNHQPGYSFPAGHRSLHGHEGVETFALDTNTVIRIREFQKKNGFSNQAFALAISALTTYCLTGKKVFMLTSLTHGRSSFLLKQTIGCMMNPVPLSFRIDPEKSVETMIKETYYDLMDVLSHANFPMSYQMIIGLKYNLLRGFNFLHFWFFMSMLDIGKYRDQSEYQWGYIEAGFIAEPLYCFLMTPSENEMNFKLLYQKRKFTPEKIQTMIKTFEKIIFSVLDTPENKIGDIIEKTNGEDEINDDLNKRRRIK